MEIRLVLIRHGMTAANAERRYIGRRTDPPLSEQGLRELSARRDKGAYPRVDGVFSGTLLRCTETARLLYPMLVPVAMPALNEMDFGTFEGKNYDQLKDDPSYRRWVDSAGLVPPPGGEGSREFSARLKGALHSIAEDVRRSQLRSAAVITHGGCILQLMDGMEREEGVSRRDTFYQHQVPCGGGYSLLFDTETLRLRAPEIL